MALYGKSIKDVPVTRLKGFKNFLSDGIMSGELDVDMTIVQLANKIDELMTEGEAGYFNKKSN